MTEPRARKPKRGQRLDDLTDAAPADVQRLHVLGAAQEALRLAAEKGNLAQLNAALTNIGKILGVYVDVQRVENSYEGLSDEQFAARIVAELGTNDFLRETARRAIAEYDASRGGPPSGGGATAGGGGDAPTGLLSPAGSPTPLPRGRIH